jgi:hypothetical protein
VKTPGTPSELDEVERAMSVLDGRHPDFVRAARLTREAAQAREQAIRAERIRAWRRRAKLALRTVLVLGAAATSAWVGLRIVSRMRDLSAALDAAAGGLVADGFVVVASSNIVAPHKLEVQASAPMCFIAVASARSGDMLVTRGTSVASHARSIGWCACDPEHVVITAPASAGPTQGVRLYGVHARALGGPQGWASARSRPDALASGGDECQEDVLVGWIADRRFPKEPVDARWIESGAGSPLSRAGFRPVAGSSVGRRFAVVEAQPGECMLALRPSRDAKAEPLLLEDMEGTILARGGSLLWCDLRGRALTVRSNAAAVVLVVAAPAARVGGLLGAREWTARTDAQDPTTWATPESLAPDAAMSLRASGLPEVIEGSLPPPTRFVGVSLRTAASLVRDALPKGTLLACSPALESGTLEATCAQVGAQPWFAAAGEKIGLAGAPTPFWLTALDDHLELGALRAELGLLALARRLTSEGFELTMFSGMTELAPGRISVHGRARDDAVVAVEVAASPPWVMPYSDASPWTLDGEPREVPLAPDNQVTLTASPRPEADSKERRTILFRRARSR